MAMTVPVLEETFDVKTGAHAELVESLQQSVYTEFLIERVVLASVAVGKVALGNLLTRVGVLQTLDLKHLFHVVTELSPVNSIV